MEKQTIKLPITEEQARNLFRVSFVMPRHEALELSEKGYFSVQLDEAETNDIKESLRAGMIGVELTQSDEQVAKAIAKVEIDQTIRKLLELRQKLV